MSKIFFVNNKINLKNGKTKKLNFGFFGTLSWGFLFGFFTLQHMATLPHVSIIFFFALFFSSAAVAVTLP